jgi:hypothetical protein
VSFGGSGRAAEFICIWLSAEPRIEGFTRLFALATAVPFKIASPLPINEVNFPESFEDDGFFSSGASLLMGGISLSAN